MEEFEHKDCTGCLAGGAFSNGSGYGRPITFGSGSSLCDGFGEGFNNWGRGAGTGKGYRGFGSCPIGFG